MTVVVESFCERYGRVRSGWGRVGVALFALCALAFDGAAQQQDGAAPSRQVALTFDDLPGQVIERRAEVFDSILSGIVAGLAQFDAPAVGFVNEGKLYREFSLVADRISVLDDWLEAGHELGNHTFSHPDLHTTPVPEFVEDIERGRLVIEPLSNRHGTPYRYFRHPMLHTGESREVREDVDRHLQYRGYQVAPVTIDNQEWIFARAYDNALHVGDGDLAARVVAAYLPYMDSIFGYYEQQSVAILGYELPQVLLLHANRLNARVLPDLLNGFVARGYSFVTLEEALEDPAYRRPNEYVGPAGITWLHRWALADGHRGAFFAGEPPVPPFVEEAFRLR